MYFKMSSMQKLFNRYYIMWSEKRFLLLILMLILACNFIYIRAENIYSKENRRDEINQLIDQFLNYSDTKNDTAITISVKALALSRKYKLEKMEASVLYNYGYLYYRWGMLDSAQKYLEKSLTISKEIPDSFRIAIALNRLGNVLWHKDKHLKAKNYFESALIIHKSQKNTREIGRALNNLANVYREWNDYQKAIELYLKAINYYRISNYNEGQAWLNFSLTILYKKLNDSEMALRSINKSLDFYQKLAKQSGDSTGIMLCYGQLGDIYNSLDQPEKGLEYHLLALELRKRTGVLSAIADGMTGVGQSYYTLEKYDKAQEYLKESQNLRRRLNSKDGMSTNLKYLAYIYTKRGKYQKALDTLKKGLIISEELNQSKSESQILKQMSNIYTKLGLYEKAWQVYQKYRELKNSLFNQNISKRIAALQVQHQIESRNIENEKIAKDNKINKLKLARSRLTFYYLILVLVILISIIILNIFLYRKKIQIRTLRGLIPICSKCKKIRNDQGYYQRVEQYISEHSESQFTHGICPECARELYPEYVDHKD